MRNRFAIVCLFISSAAFAQSPPNQLPGSILRGEHIPPPTQSHDLQSFDPRFADLRFNDTKWQLQSNGIVVKDFDRRELEAREAMRIIRELQLTHYGAIGKPAPVMEYWLSQGQAPTSPGTALNVISFDPLSLRIEQMQGGWHLRDARRVYFSFGQHADDARRALEVIHRYGFNQIGFVGQPKPVMIYFLSSKSQGTAPPPFHNVTMKSSQPQVPGMRTVASAPAQPHLPSAGIAPLPEQSALSERIPIDWRQVQVRQENQEWKLAFGSYVLANFGKNERDARQALAALRHYRVTEYCLVGRANPSFSYFLVNGKAPRGVMLGVSSVAFRPEQLSIRQLGPNHILTDGYRTLLNFGEKADEARQTLEAIQRYQCDRLCHIGPANIRGMDLLVRTN